MLRELNRDFGKTILMVTHDPRAAAYATVVVHLDKGKLLSVEPVVFGGKQNMSTRY